MIAEADVLVGRNVVPASPCSRYEVLASDRLGHATVSITLDTYSHAIPAMQETAALLIADVVFAGK